MIDVGGVIIAIANGLHFEERFSTLEAHFLGGSLDITSLRQITIIYTKENTYKPTPIRRFSFLSVTWVDNTFKQGESIL